MAAALALARRGLGSVWPNPAVGCVLVKTGTVVGRGWTQRGGSPHAETEALGRAESRALGATAFVSLEPCAHRGKTPPCAEALIKAGIARCVVAVEDPDPRVSGRGLDQLRQAGVSVEVGILADQARELNEGFFSRIIKGRPSVTLKLATTLDGFIATANGESQWITGSLARQRGHLMRAEHDGVLIGVGTAVSDDPMLTCRLAGMQQRSPIRIVLDSNLRLPLTNALVTTAHEHKTWIVTKSDSNKERCAAYGDYGVEVLKADVGANGWLSMKQVMNVIGRQGITRLLVEGGPSVTSSLFQEGMVDRVAWFRAPTLLGGEGINVTLPLGLTKLADAIIFRRLGIEVVGEDILESFAVVS